MQFFVNATGAANEDAEKLVRKNMKSLEHWQKNPCDCLDGVEATDEEFQSALSRLSS